MDYLNPKEPKEVWLFNNAHRLDVVRGKMETAVLSIAREKEMMDKSYIICLINNGKFRAAAVCKNEDDVLRLMDPSDHRDRLWFHVRKELADPEIKPFIIKKEN